MTDNSILRKNEILYHVSKISDLHCRDCKKDTSFCDICCAVDNVIRDVMREVKNWELVP